MKKNKGKNTNKTVNFKTFATRGLFCLILIYIAISLVQQQFTLIRLRGEDKALNEQLTAVQKEAKELEAQKSVVGTDEYIERVARERLGFMKSYEKVFIDANK